MFAERRARRRERKRFLSRDVCFRIINKHYLFIFFSSLVCIFFLSPRFDTSICTELSDFWPNRARIHQRHRYCCFPFNGSPRVVYLVWLTQTSAFAVHLNALANHSPSLFTPRRGIVNIFHGCDDLSRSSIGNI